MNKLVSIALCTYNGEKYLVEQLDSIVNQTYPYIELVIVDDGSTDRTLAIIENYINRFPIRLFKNERNLGYVKNFEKACSLCRGEYIALCDQDDIWQPEKIAALVEIADKHILVYADSQLIDEQGKSLLQTVKGLKNFVEGNNSLPFLFHNCVSGHAILFKKELLTYALPFPASIYHDQWLAYVASTIGTISYSSAPLVKYRQHPQSMTDIRIVRQRENFHHKNARILTNLQICNDFNRKNGKDTHVTQRLIELYQARTNAAFCLPLFLYLCRHSNELFYILKKPQYKKLHIAFKEAAGGKLRRK